jgi:hypothetical protein
MDLRGAVVVSPTGSEFVTALALLSCMELLAWGNIRNSARRNHRIVTPVTTARHHTRAGQSEGHASEVNELNNGST